jgi:hypothetical protein
MNRLYNVEKKHDYTHDLSHTKIRGFFIRIKIVVDDLFYILCEETKEGIIEQPNYFFHKGSVYYYKSQANVSEQVAFWVLALIRIMREFENKKITLAELSEMLPFN